MPFRRNYGRYCPPGTPMHPAGEGCALLAMFLAGFISFGAAWLAIPIYLLARGLSNSEDKRAKEESDKRIQAILDEHNARKRQYTK